MSRGFERYTVVESPIGPLVVVTDGAALTGLNLPSPDGGPVSPSQGQRVDREPLLAEAAAQLSAYFDRRSRHFDLPLALAGTAFQRSVWESVRAVPFGETVTYAEVARRVGAPGSARAVGAAMGRNPVAVVVPCHRVIGSGGGLTGYGGGLDRKRWLLEHEGAACTRASARSMADALPLR